MADKLDVWQGTLTLIAREAREWRQTADSIAAFFAPTPEAM